jgi:23S rRNA (cytosine1962-C5)-methyltransferase
LKSTILKSFPNGLVEAGEVGLPITRDSLVLPCGIYGRWESND